MQVRAPQSSLHLAAAGWLQAGLEARLRIGEQVASGRRVHRPSDDTPAFARILRLRGELATLGLDGAAGAAAREALQQGEALMADATDALHRARLLALQGAGPGAEEVEREALAAEAGELLQALLASANSRHGEAYLFGGGHNALAPFEIVQAAGGSRVVYRGGKHDVAVRAAPGVEAPVLLSGEQVFLHHRRGETLFSGATGAASAGGGDTGTGFAALAVEHTGYTGLPAGIAPGDRAATALGPLSYTTTSGPPPTISLGGGPPVPFTSADTDLEVPTAEGTAVYLDMSAFAPADLSGTLVSTARMTADGGASFTEVDFDQASQRLTHSGAGWVLHVDTRGIRRTGTDQVKFQGTFDPFHALLALRDTLRNREDLPPEELRARLRDLAGEMDFARDAVLAARQDTGARAAQLDLLADRLSSLAVVAEGGISAAGDTDLPSAAALLVRAEVSYQAALAASTRLLQLSLLHRL